MSKLFKFPVKMTSPAGLTNIFFGSNALGHALAYLWDGQSPTREVFTEKAQSAPIDLACYWRETKYGLTTYDAKPLTSADNCHAKVYLVSGRWVVLSSQNNGLSHLLEFAVVYEDEHLYKWFYDQIIEYKRNRQA